MNTRLLRKVAKHIAEEPRRLDMNCIISNSPLIDPKEMPPCGTVGCIAGWTCVLSGKKQVESDLDLAADLLGLDAYQRDRLFAEPKFWDNLGSYYGGWPRRFALAYLQAKTPRGKASATVARIEWFIKTKGAE